MKRYWENLRSFEKRVVVAGLVIAFAVFNYWFVFPHFSDWKKVSDRITKARDRLKLFQEGVSHTSEFEEKIKSIGGGDALEIPPEEQTMHFGTTIRSRADASGVQVLSTTRPSTRTNQFLIEQTESLHAQATEQQLVNFLFDLGSENSLIRVRDLGLNPDGPRQQLQANIKLVASYTRAGAKPAPAAKPAVPAPSAPAPAPPAAASPVPPASKTAPATNNPATTPATTSKKS